MNTQIFTNLVGELGLPGMTLQTAFTEDDIGAILRIHLMTEKLVESWICAACNQADFFGKGEDRIKIDYDEKIKIAKNLSFPSALYNALKTINKIRNDAAHLHNFSGIPNNKIDSLKDTLNGYRLNEYKGDKHSDEMPMELYNSDGSIKGTYSMNSSETPNRLKLFLLFMMFQTKLMLTVNRIHLAQGANPDNNSSV